MRLEWVGRELRLCGLYIGQVVPLRPDSHQWRAWLMTDDDGEEISRHDTEQEARDALESRVRGMVDE